MCSERLEKNFWPKDMETQPRASTRESKNNNKIRPNPPSTPRARERERERERERCGEGVGDRGVRERGEGESVTERGKKRGVIMTMKM